ncbi:MAG TPA: hypothetical protein VJB60_04140 [Candidatus Peribacterales bacterium]|nr:hypothetical protein [Candidatus Peribacterales bacterium]
MATPENAKGKNSTRNRKKGEATGVQRFLPIAEIRQDTVLLKNGGLRAVLGVGSMNFSLKSDDEQQAIIVSYEQFLNTLTFPLQIVIRSTKLNVDGYVGDLQGRAEKQQNPLLKEQTLDYARFIERLVDVSDIMQKRFYVVVPIDPAGVKNVSFLSKLFGWLAPSDTREKALTRKRQFEELSTTLRDRVNLVKTGLANVGCPSERLKTPELIDLYYTVYNPKTSQEQKLPGVEGMNVKEYIL